jgi:hypothetical protein
MEWLSGIFGGGTIIQWGWSLIVPTIMAAVYKYFQRAGIAVTQERIDQINKMALARGGELITMLLSGKIGWADLAVWAKKLAIEALVVNPDIKAQKGMTDDVMTKRILSEFGKLASSDPTMALPTPPAGALVGNVAVAGPAAKADIKEVADAPTVTPIVVGGSIPHRDNPR